MTMTALMVTHWLVSAQGLNCLFALLCLCAAFGANGRTVMMLSALLYVAMALV